MATTPFPRFGAALPACLLGAALITTSAQAAFEKSIVRVSDGAEIGSITFPTLVGPPGGSLVGVALDLDGFTTADITSAEWELNSTTREVDALALRAFQGDNVCPIADFTACSNRTLFVTESSFSVSRVSCNGSGGCFFIAGNGIFIGFEDATPAFACEGFKGPLAKGPVAIKRQRLHWLRATLRDADGKRLRRRDLPAPPVLDVAYQPPADAATRSLAAWPGIGGDGTAFVNVGSQWHLLLKLGELTDPGTYTVRMLSGDPATYSIDPTCVGTFVR